MIRNLLVAGATLFAMAAFTLASYPADAGSCVGLSGKARGLHQADVGKRSAKHLNHKINHWAHKNGYKTVRVGHIGTACSKGKVLTVCTSSAKVCP